MLRSRLSWGHGPLLLNEHINADGTYDRTKVNDTIVLDERLSEPTFRDTRDPYHLTTGGALGAVHKGMAYFRLRGRILVPDASQQARLSDRERQLRTAFDPSLCLYDSPATDGAYALDWDEPTSDSANWPTGKMTQRVFARPVAQPQLTEAILDGTVRPFTLGLVAPDPRRFAQADSTLSLTPGAPSGDVVNLGTVPAPLKAAISMSGAGSSTFTISRGSTSFVLNLSTMANLDLVIVVFETSGPYGRGRRITKNGTENFALKTSGVNTWLDVPVGTTSFSIANTAGIASCVLSWRAAWA